MSPRGGLTLARLIDLTSAGPQRVFGIAGKGRIAVGYDADFTVVDLKARWTIERELAGVALRLVAVHGDGADRASRSGRSCAGAGRCGTARWARRAIGEPIRFEATETPGNAAPSLRPAPSTRAGASASQPWWARGR